MPPKTYSTAKAAKKNEKTNRPRILPSRKREYTDDEKKLFAQRGRGGMRVEESLP